MPQGIFGKSDLARSFAGRVQYGFRPNMLRQDYGKIIGMQEKSPKAGQISASIHGLTHGEKLGALLSQVVYFRLDEQRNVNVDPSILTAIDPILTDRILGLVDKKLATPQAICNTLVARLAERNHSIDAIVRGLVVDDWKLDTRQKDTTAVTKHLRGLSEELAAGIAITYVKDAVIDRGTKSERLDAAKAQVDSLMRTWGFDSKTHESLTAIYTELVNLLEKQAIEIKQSANGTRYLRVREAREIGHLPKERQESIRAALAKLRGIGPKAESIGERMIAYFQSTGESKDRLTFENAVKAFKQLLSADDAPSKSWKKVLACEAELKQTNEELAPHQKKIDNCEKDLSKANETMLRLRRQLKLAKRANTDIDHLKELERLYQEAKNEVTDAEKKLKDLKKDKEYFKIKGTMLKIGTLEEKEENLRKAKEAFDNEIKPLYDIMREMFEFSEDQLHTKEAEFLEFLYRRMIMPGGRSSEEIAEHMIITRKVPTLVEPKIIAPDNFMRASLRVSARLIEENGAGGENGANGFERAENAIAKLRDKVTYAEANRRSEEIEGMSGVISENNVDRDGNKILNPFDHARPLLSMLNSRFMTLFDVDYRVVEGYMDKFRYFYYGHPAYYYMGMPQSGRNFDRNNLANAIQDGMDAYWGLTLKVDSLPEINAVLPWGAGMAHALRVMTEDSEWIPTMDYEATHKRPWQWINENILNKIQTKSKNGFAKFLVSSTKDVAKAFLFLNPITLLAQFVDVFIIYPRINERHENAVHHLGNKRKRQEIQFNRPIWYQPISSETRSESEDMGTAPHHIKLIPMASRFGKDTMPLRRSAFIDGKAGHGSNADDYTVLWNTLRARWNRGNQSIRSWVLKTPMAALTHLRFTQRIDYWSMQFKRVFFLSMPPAFALAGITPVAVAATNWVLFSSLAFAGYVLGMGTYFMEMRAQGKSIRSCMRSIVLDYYGMLQGLKSSILGKYLNDRVTFIVSPKKTYAIMKTPMSELKFELGFLGLNTLAGGITTALGVLSLGTPFGWLMFCTSFWAFHNSAFIGSALYILNKGVKIENSNEWIKEHMDQIATGKVEVQQMH